MRRFIALALLAFTASVATAAPTCVVGTAGAAPVAALNFPPPTTDTDGSPIATPLTYQLWQGSASGNETLKASGLSGSPIVLNTGLTSNSSVYVYLVVVDANGTASVPTNEVCKIFPKATPSTFVITIT